MFNLPPATGLGIGSSTTIEVLAPESEALTTVYTPSFPLEFLILNFFPETLKYEP